MVGHMTSTFNIAVGVGGAILGGAVGASWAMTQFVVYRLTDDFNSLLAKGQGFTFDQVMTGEKALTGFGVGLLNNSTAGYDWFRIVPVTIAAALAGAFIVLVGVGILRKLYR